MPYPDDLVRNTLGLALTLLEIGGAAIELCGVRILIKARLNAKEFFIDVELVPVSVGASSECLVVATELRGGRGISGRLPCLELAFARGGLLLADIGIRSER